MAAVVLALTVQVHLPESHSLKDKRAVISSILDGSRRRFGVTAAETGHADRWQRAELCFAVAAGSPTQASSVIDSVDRFVWSFPELDVLDTERSWLELD